MATTNAALDPNSRRARRMQEEGRASTTAKKPRRGAKRPLWQKIVTIAVALALMGTDMKVILLLVAAYLFVAGSMVYYLCRYHKEM